VSILESKPTKCVGVLSSWSSEEGHKVQGKRCKGNKAADAWNIA
jgi:hypothetical protein